MEAVQIDVPTHAPKGQLRHLLEQARKRLVETGSRNRLVHTSRHTKRSKSIDIVDERSA